MHLKARTMVVLGALLAACGGRGGEEEVATEELPVPIAEPSPIEYPVALWDRGVRGETELMVHVTDMGDVDSVLVSKSSGFAELDSAALAGARKVRFSPGRRGDRRIAKWIRMPVRFSQDSVASIGMPLDSSGQ